MVPAIAASASTTNAPHHLPEDMAHRVDSGPSQLAEVHPRGVIVDISALGMELSENEAVNKAQEALAKMDVNLDGKLSIDQFSVVAPAPDTG